MKHILLLVLFALICFPLFASFEKSEECSMNRPAVLILLGAPGAGKGTQAVRLSQKHAIPHISTGDLFRDNLRLNTPLGQKVKTYMEKGQLVPDDLVLEMLFDRLAKEDCAKGYILDGVPRTISQAEALDKYFTDVKATVSVISLEVPDAVIIERLTGRIVCEKCSAPYHKTANPPKQPGICDRCGSRALIQRKDDSEAIVRERLEVYHVQTEPLKAYYAKQGLLTLVDGAVSKENTDAQIDQVLVNVLNKKI